MESTAQSVDQSGVRDQGEFDQRRHHFVIGARLLADHPAVTKFGFGVASSDIADYQGKFAALAAARITGVGREYESDEGQAYEARSMSALLVDALEEVADGINYLTFIASNLQHLQARLRRIQGSEFK